MKIKEFLIDEECSMIEAMELLDRLAKKVLFIAKDGKLIAAITDGDIRRWILKKGSLEAKVKDIANYKPTYLFSKNRTKAKEFMLKHSLEALPIVDENMRIVSILFWDNEIITNQKKINTPVVIMAGGKGTRLHPFTKILPKPLIPIGEVPIIEHIINRFNQAGCKKFYLIVNHKRNMIKAYFNENIQDYQITYVNEEKPLGTGGGLSLLKGQINETFILSNCDILIEDDYEKILGFHIEKKNLITMVCSLKRIKIPYGVVDIGETGEIEKMIEKPEVSFFTNTGIYIVEPQVIDALEVDTHIDFPDIIKRYKEMGQKIGVYPISEHAWMDMGQFDEMDEMRRRLDKNG